MQSLKILCVDDHPFVCQGYKIFIENHFIGNDSIVPNIHSACSSEEAYNKVFGKNSFSFNIVILDINIPAFPKMGIYSGEDLGVILRKKKPQTKIIIATSHSQNHRLYNVFTSINPDGLLIKTDLNQKTFISAIEDVLSDKIYYSQTFSQLIRNQFSQVRLIDAIDREILHWLSQGIMTKNLPHKVPLSISAIEKRKKNLKKYFNIETASTFELIKTAKEKGYL
ncbi:response regulator [Muricauda sp. SCSIO 64092]|uniref:response regulator n=1 Tax=Allomuricauda sp. SCSIO 64092 TaxID=2908842 RepID=UPI001FF4CFB2|nr:response regulator [Muricauda sp. SCSIO 64092]UOY09020.1 response regulator [Muricauda sp. SCSIO 64092]